MSFADRVFLASIRKGPLELIGLHALRKANHLLGLALGQRIAELRESGDPMLVAQSRIEERDVLLGLSEFKCEILAERWDPVPVRRRPHYTPEARFKILRYKHIKGLSCEETGREYRVAGATIARWEKELSADPDKKTIGTLLRPMPPVGSYADVVREVVLSMVLTRFGGDEIIADTLARAGWKLSATTVARNSTGRSPRQGYPMPRLRDAPSRLATPTTSGCVT